jgi:hypothetical protein
MIRAHVLLPLLALAPAALAAQGDSPATLASRISAASALPALAQEIRGSGVTGPELTSLLDVFRTKGIPAPDAKVILEEEWSASREHGPVRGLGPFVQARLDEGLRGRELAAAIRAEHAARGIGGDGLSDEARGKAGERSKTGEREKVDGRGNQGDRAPSTGRGNAPASPKDRADDRKPTNPGDRKVEAPR